MRAGLTEGIDEGICDGAALGAEDHECGGFEWFDEAVGVADGEDIADPASLVTPGGELHDAGAFHFWVLF